MYRAPRRALLAAPLLAVLGGAAIAATAGERERTESALTALSGQASASALAARPLQQAQEALGRADDARAAGDAAHAARLEALAHEWATTGTDLVRAAAVEGRAGAAEGRAAALEDKTRRARALLEQTIARRGRAEAHLAQLEAATAASASSTPVRGSR